MRLRALLVDDEQLAREELAFKVDVGPSRARYVNGKRAKASPTEPDASSWWTVPEHGAVVRLPWSWRVAPLKILRRVDFPAPFLPTRA